jgi:homocitrate synthase NifV
MNNRHIILEDTTLRDGEQAPGVAFSPETKVAIFHALINAGVKWIEAGIPAMKGKEVEALRAMLERKEEVNLIGWNRGVLDDIKFTISLGFKAIHIGLPTSDIHLKHSIGKNKPWLLNAASDLVKYAKDKGCFVSISAEDVGRTELNFLQEYAETVYEAGADRLRLSDTIGILDSAAYAKRVKTVADACAIKTQCHCHNDFGLAVPNTLAGLQAGATYFHSCINGIGERAGMPDMAQMVMALRQFHGVDTGVDTRQLTHLSQLVSQACDQPLLPWQPIVGSNVFAHESGIHTKGMLSSSKTFEPFEPALVGNERKLCVGKHSGRTVIRHVLEENGIVVSDTETLEKCLVHVRDLAIENRGQVTPQELVNIYSSLQQGVVNV